MTAHRWWADTLQAFATALKIPFEIVTAPRPSVRQTGEWWLQQTAWCVHLEDSTYACLPGFPSDDAMRHALSVALVSAFGAAQRHLSWREILTKQFSELVNRALTEDWSLPSSWVDVADSVRTRELIAPGAFVWLEFAHSSEDAMEFRGLVEEVVGALEQTTFVGWTRHPLDHDAAIVFFAQDDQDDATDWDDNEVESSAESATEHVDEVTQRRRRLGALIHLLLGALESDAMVPAKATSGAPIDTVAGWPRGLQTLAEAWREHVWFSPEQPVYLWGERPFAYLLANLKVAALDPFLQMVSARDGGVLLPTDLMDTLQGILTANLNISEASRLLYLHRNTLMNRIERIRSLTGYDVRQFNDALVLWVAQSLLRRKGERG